MGEFRAQNYINYILRSTAPEKQMIVGLLLFLAWSLGHEIIPSSITDFPNIHELPCVTAHLDKSLRDLSSQPLQIPLYLTQSMSEISSELDNPQELRNRKAELRLKLIKLKAD